MDGLLPGIAAMQRSQVHYRTRPPHRTGVHTIRDALTDG